jgi:hypothetical protein
MNSTVKAGLKAVRLRTRPTVSAWKRPSRCQLEATIEGTAGFCTFTRHPAVVHRHAGGFAVCLG